MDVDVGAATVVIADDDVLLREALASLLDRAGFHVVGQAGDATELLQLVDERRPAIVIVDVRMAPSYTTEGIEAASAIRAKYPRTAIMVLSAHVDVSDATSVLLSEPSTGYLLKSGVTDVTAFVAALTRITKGATIIDRTLVAELMSAPRPQNPLAVLNSREQKVLALIAEGLSNAGIARRLEVTTGTVAVYINRLFRKLGLTRSDDDHRRVRAVITYLDARQSSSSQFTHPSQSRREPNRIDR